MRVVAAYLLAKLGGKESPSAGDLKNILGSVGAEADNGKIELFLSLVKDHDITELVAVGREKMAAFSSSVAGGAAVAGGTGGIAPAAAAGAVAEEKKKEEKEEAKDESDEDPGIFSLFD